MEVSPINLTRKNFQADLKIRLKVVDDPRLDNYCNCYSTAFYLAGMIESPYLPALNSELERLQLTFNDIVRALEQNHRILAQDYDIFKHRLKSKENDLLEILQKGVLVAFITDNYFDHWMFIDPLSPEYIYQRIGIGYGFERIRFEEYLDENKISSDSVRIYG